jgi:transcriptional regulator with XRE-family HTH domain
MQNIGLSAPLAVTSARQVLAENMVLLRRSKGYSQEALAFEAGLHRTFVAHVERRVRNISVDNIERIARALGVQTFELLTPQFGALP